jgi:D-inositol-3-phosphate glycosyltransferase
MKRRGCFCLRQGHITDEYLSYDRPIAPYGLEGYIADRDCKICAGTGYQKGNKLKILFVGDAACSTGFALCTHQLCDRLHANGHDVTVLGINAYGDPHNSPYTIYPCVNPLDRSRMICGEERLPKLICRLRPDIVIILQDPWNIRGYMREIEEQLGEMDIPRPLMIGWLAVDSKNQISGKQLNQLDHVVTWTQFGIDELRAGGYTGPHSIIGLGVDTSIYYPIDRTTARRSTLSDGSPLLPEGIPIDSYIIGVVGRNQTRKRLDLVLEHFSAWTKQHAIDNAYLHLHVGPTGEQGCNIEALLKYYGIKAIISAPPTSGALTTSDMNLIYNCFDLFWSMSQAEGWNLPALEAMACGIPCLLPEQGAPAEWTLPAAELIECTSTALTAPMNRGPYTIGGIADRAQTIAALDRLYRYPAIREQLSQLGLDLARKLSWDVVGEQWEGLLQSLWSAKHQPTMTDLMISPESIDSALDNSPRCDKCGGLTCPGTLGYDCDPAEGCGEHN